MKIMKKICLLLLLLVCMPTAKAKAKEIQPVNIYLFYSEFCSTCAAEEKWLEEVYGDNSHVKIVSYEVMRNKDNAVLLENVRKALENKDLTTPYTVIGSMGLTGFNDTIKSDIEKAVNKYQSQSFVDVVDVVVNHKDTEFEIDYPDSEFDIPILGNVKAKDVSLPLVSIVIGFIDGFNPCAMWVLLFLISMLFNMKNRKRMWILGITFLVTSAIIYLCFMLAWLGIAISLTSISWVRLIIGIVALLGGAINLSSYLKERKKDDGCEVIDDGKRKKMFSRIKKIIHHVEERDVNATWFQRNKNFLLALLGIIGLAVSVNMVELACSSGLPLIFTQILAYNQLNGLEYFMYILLYIIFFLIDDIVVFVIAMKTLKLTGFSTKYNKLSHLIGGIIMVLIGILMIFKPEWIMFHF